MLVVVLLAVAVVLLVLGVVLETALLSVIALVLAVIAAALFAYLARASGSGPVENADRGSETGARAPVDGKPAAEARSTKKKSAVTGAGPVKKKPAAEAGSTKKPSAEAVSTKKPTAEAGSTEKPTAEAVSTKKPAAEAGSESKPAATEARTAEKPPVVAPATATVHVVPGRRRFHLAGCSMLEGQSGDEVTVAEAQGEGFTACTLCAPTAAHA